MGAYTNNLFRRRKPTKRDPNVERLTSAAILRLDACHSGFRSHAQIRSSLGDDEPYESKPSDTEGFLTSRGRFVTREEAKGIGERAGQCRPSIRPLLSSDIDW